MPVSNVVKRILQLLTLFAATALRAQDTLPPGTILPVMLKQEVHARAGEAVRGRVMQDVPLPNHQKLKAGSVLAGSVTRVDASNGRTAVSLRFDRIESRGKRIPVTTALRALATYVDVYDAQVPPNGLDRFTPYNAATLVLIGGDISYRGGGPVMHGTEKVGHPEGDGVLVRVLPNRERGCLTPYDSNHSLQSLWVFSSDACGPYGFSKVLVLDRGIRDGEITLGSSGPNVLHSGDGLLLVVVAPAR